MTEDSFVIRQDIGGGESFDTAFGTINVEAVGGGARDMQPVGISDSADACLVAVKDGCLDENFTDFSRGRSDLFGVADDGLHYAARAGAVADKILADFRSALAGDDLANIELTLTVCMEGPY